MPRLIARTATTDDVYGLLEPGYHQEGNLIELPEVTEDELWRTLGFAEVPTSNRYKELEVGLRSMRCDGFHNGDLVVVGNSLTWTSAYFRNGRPMCDVISTTVEWDVAKATLRCVRTSYEFDSGSSKKPSVTFSGGPLDNIVGDRLNVMLAIIGGRVSNGNCRLTGEEVDRYTGLHPSPVKAWVDANGRVVLEDDDYGYSRGYLESEGDTTDLVSALRRIGWTTIQY